MTRQPACALRARGGDCAPAWDAGWQKQVRFRGERAGTWQRHDDRQLETMMKAALREA